jgi:preprotein translocase subunit Sec61beta
MPVQYFQSIITIQLAVAGALLFQVRFFDNSNAKSGPQVDPRLRLVVIAVIAATLVNGPCLSAKEQLIAG